MTETVFGKYRVVEKVGAGGFGEVFKGLDPVLNRHVAIKTCSSGEDELRRRFLREAEIAARLQHPNIVTVFDFGYHGESPYLVQEYLSGEDLDHKIKRRDPLSLQTKLDYLLKIAAGLRYAHAHDVIHRDVKPANVRVLEDGQVRVMDFGIAKLMTAETQLTRTGMALGTAAYLPPEQLLGRRLDPRADQFSFGVLAYELLTWERPFGGESMSTVLYAIAHQDPVPITDRWSACPSRLATVIETCLEKEPEERFPDLARVITELEAVAGSLTASAAVAAGQLAAQAPESPSPAHAPPPVPRLADTVAIDGQATTRQTVGSPGKEQTDRASRKLMVALVAVAMVIAVGLTVLFLVKRIVDRRKARIAAATTISTPTPAVAVPAPVEPASDGTEDEAAGLPETAGVEQQPAYEEPVAASRDPGPRADRRSRTSAPRSGSEATATTPAAVTPAEETMAAQAGSDTGAPVAEATPEPPAEPAPLIVSTSYGLELGRLVPGQRVYVDRDFVYDTVPGEYLDLPCIKTPNNLRREASALTFTVTRPVEVFVAHDQRVTRKPMWLASFRKTGQIVTVDEGGKRQAVTYDVYVRRYAAGVVKLGSSAPPRQRRKHRISMYSIFLRPSSP